MGTYFLEELLQLKKEFPDVIGDVRGKGMMIGVEFVTDKVRVQFILHYLGGNMNHSTVLNI